jgi:hypothetical protein
MNPSSWRARLVETLFMLVVVAVVTRAVSEILGPVLPGLVGLLLAVGLLIMLVRRR